MAVRARVATASVTHFRRAHFAEGAGEVMESQIRQTTYAHLIPVLHGFG